MLRLDGIDAGYDGTQVLWGVGLETKAKSMTVIIGANGAGKSTILKVVNGLLKPTRGTVQFNGEDITHVPAYERPGLGLASVPEGRRLFPSLTTEANLRLGAYAARGRRHAEETLGSVYRMFPRLRERSRLKAGRLSGGEQQMVAIGRALMARPSLLVLDEPTSQLDPAGTRLVGDALVRFAEENGTAVLLVEHKTGLVARIADEVAVLVGGRIVQHGPTNEILADPALAEHGVDPPPAVRIERAVAAAGRARDLAGLDLAALETEPIAGSPLPTATPA